ncbi:MAG: hypothetical protein J1E98_03025 [Lachnospiraceae bacterium]|nr:hypothetical protein [Lachnospiraceae bacterium]
MNKNTILEELEPDFFVDNDSGKWGKTKWNVEIISPNDIKKCCKNPLILISSANAKTCQEIVDQLIDMDILEYHMLDEIIWGRHKNELLEVYDILESDYSRELFAAIIISRIMGQEIPEEYISGEQCFAIREFKMRRPKEIFVDCGAYVGDTIEQYLYRKEAVFNEIYAFEPEEMNMIAMSKRMERLQSEWAINKNKIHLIQGAVGRSNGKLFMNNDRESMSAKVTNLNT